MKTAIQELIEKIQYSIDVQSGVSLTETQVNTLKAVMLIAETLLEKEKEQILRAFDLGMHECLAYDTNSNNYYNQTYNQNELPKTYINGVEVDSNNSSVTTTGTGVWTPKTN
jgi:CYTH domain-containing protein